MTFWAFVSRNVDTFSFKIQLPNGFFEIYSNVWFFYIEFIAMIQRGSSYYIIIDVILNFKIDHLTVRKLFTQRLSSGFFSLPAFTRNSDASVLILRHFSQTL